MAHMFFVVWRAMERGDISGTIEGFPLSTLHEPFWGKLAYAG